MHALSLQLVVSPFVDEDEKPCRKGWVAATIDNKKLGSAGAPLDFYSLLAYRKLSGPMELLTCSCGVAGCAGFHCDVIQTWGDHTVTWSLDAKEYGEILPGLPTDPENPGNVLVTVRTEALEAAIDDLYAQLRSALAEGPLHLVPGNDDQAIVSVDELEESFIAQREWFLRERAREATEREAFGEFADSVVRAHFPCGVVMQASVRALVMSLLLHEADEAGIDLQVDALEYAYRGVRTVWRLRLANDPQALLRLLQSKPWEDVGVQFWCVKRPEAGAPAGDLTKTWAQARLELPRPTGR